MPTEDTTSAPAGANWVESVVAGGDELAVAMAIHGILVAPREAVEALARELGWWWRDPHSRWSIQPDSGGFCVVDWDKPSPCPEWPLPTPEALLLLHLARLGPTRERCKDCEGRMFEEAEVTSDQRRGFDREELRFGWEHIGGTLAIDGAQGSKIYRRPCPTCTGPVECEACHGIGEAPPLGHSCQPCGARGHVPGKPTGWVTREHGWAERWLRARPQECHGCPACDGTIDDDGPRCVGLARPGDPEARADLLVLADQLQDQGDPLGDWLALWLAGQPCEDCSGEGQRDVRDLGSALVGGVVHL